MAKKKSKPRCRSFLSPIELQLRNAIVEQANIEAHNVSLFDYSTSVVDAVASFHEECGIAINDDDLIVDPQFHEYGDGEDVWSMYGSVRLLTYRIDLLMVTFGHELAIECDGHEFHDRTKQQASADRARDRELLGLGIPTVRFTGSDIFHRADECAAEIFSILKSLDRRKEDRIQTARRAGQFTGERDGYNLATLRGQYRGCFAGCLAELG